VAESSKTSQPRWVLNIEAGAAMRCVCDVNEDGYPDLYILSMSGDDKY
jgi:hypothetical protein